MRRLLLMGLTALIVVLLAMPGAVSAADLTVSGSIVKAESDLNPTAIGANPGAGAFMFANEPNVIEVTINNLGTDPAPASTLSVNVDGAVYTAPVGAIPAGGSLKVTVTDTLSRTGGDSVTVTATADSGNVIAEGDETNNALTQALTVYNNGYKGKRWTGGPDMNTQAGPFEGRIDVVYSAGNSAYNSASWTEKTYTWSSTDLPIPSGATITSARLYQGYTYNKMATDPAWTLSFNGNAISPAATYKDIKGFGSYSYPYGLYVYDVTGAFDAAGNSMTITPETGNDYGIYGAYLVVVYTDNAGATEKKIWINDEFDMVQSQAAYSVTTEEATVYASFADVDTTGMASARAIAILSSASDAEKSRFFFNNNEYTGFWSNYLATPQLGFSSYDVTAAINSGSNTARLQSYDPGTKGDNMYAQNVILVVERAATEPPAVDFTATPTSGDAPLEVQFDATNTGGPVNSWKWEYSTDGTTWTEFATIEDPMYTFTTAGTYSIRLTAQGPDSADTETKAGYIQVGMAVIDVSVSPASIDFGTMTAGVDETGSTGVTVDVTGGTGWSVSASASNGGYMGTGTTNLANPFQLSNDGTIFQPMTSSFANFLTGTAGVDGSGTASVKQAIAASDTPGVYSITLTFTGSFA